MVVYSTTDSYTIRCGFLSESSLSFGKQTFNNISFSLNLHDYFMSYNAIKNSFYTEKLPEYQLVVKYEQRQLINLMYIL